MARVTPAQIDALDMPDKLKDRYKKLAELGLSEVELNALLEQNEYTPVVVEYDIRTNARMSEEQLEALIEDFRKDVNSRMMAREVGFIFLKGLSLAAKAAAKGALL